MSGEGGRPLRVGLRDGNTRESVAPPLAMEEGLARGLEGVGGLVAESQAYRQRTWGLCLEKGIGVVPLVPRPWAVRQALEAWGQQQPAWPVVAEQPGRTQREAPRRWQGHRVSRQVDVADREGRVAPEAWRLVVVPSSQLAQQHVHT